MEKFPELVQYKIAEYLVLIVPTRNITDYRLLNSTATGKQLREVIKLYTVSGYRNDNVEGLLWPGEEHQPDCCVSAALAGNLPLLQWCEPSIDEYIQMVAYSAVMSGNGKMLKWLGEKDKLVYDDIMLLCATRRGDLAIMKWLFGNGSPLTDQLFNAATALGNLGNLKWLHSVACPKSHLTMDIAVGLGNVENMTWLLRIGCPLTCGTFCAAVCTGKLDLVLWVRDRGCPSDVEAFGGAIRTQNLAMMKWVHENGYPWSVNSFADAVNYDITKPDMEIVKWLHNEGCPWDSETFASAVFGYCVEEGHTNHYCDNKKSGLGLELVKFLNDNACPMDAESFRIAVDWGNMDMMELLLMCDCPYEQMSVMIGYCNTDEARAWVETHL